MEARRSCTSKATPPTAYAWSTTETRSSYISSDEDGEGRTVLAVDRGTRWVVAQARQQVDVAEDAYSRLYGDA